ncbi:hypothetical protein BI334_21910 [Moorena producens 3L]|uniref:Uncharacterized protein n=1 Tax=Moorena producens (strain JHB) TaxID=1454205 RepID=A0A1D9G4W7_MOOP1|nr:hypothetical protein BI334_21910 [Moorena producens 3L]
MLLVFMQLAYPTSCQLSCLQRFAIQSGTNSWVLGSRDFGAGTEAVGHAGRVRKREERENPVYLIVMQTAVK